MKLAIGTQLVIGEAHLEVTEVRIPCKQLNGIHERLLNAVATKENGKKSFKAGIMARVRKGGRVRPGDSITIVSTGPV